MQPFWMVPFPFVDSFYWDELFHVEFVEACLSMQASIFHIPDIQVRAGFFHVRRYHTLVIFSFFIFPVSLETCRTKLKGQLSSVRSLPCSMSLRGFMVVVSPPFTIPISTLHLLLIHLCSAPPLKICTRSIRGVFLMFFLSLVRVLSIVSCTSLPGTGIVLLTEGSGLRSVA